MTNPLELFAQPSILICCYMVNVRSLLNIIIVNCKVTCVAHDRWYYHLDNDLYVVLPDVLCVSTWLVFSYAFSLKVITLQDVRKAVITVGILRLFLENLICFVEVILILLCKKKRKFIMHVLFLRLTLVIIM